MDSYEDEATFDILSCFPVDFCEKVFGRLDSDDLLRASLVSTHWYNFIAKNSVCMQKIKLTFSHLRRNQLTPDMKYILMESPRKYENLELKFQSGSFRDVMDIMRVPGRAWKKVSVFRINFAKAIDGVDFIVALEPTVEELRMDKVYMDSIYYDGPKRDLKFPKMKILETKYIQSQFYYDALAGCCALKELNITSGDLSYASHQAGVERILQTNTSLKKLTIVSNMISQYFKKDLAQHVFFKLNSLEIRDIYNLEVQPKMHFQNFLRKQMMSLETLQIGDWMGLEAVKMIFHMPKLNKFTFKGFYGIEVELKEVQFHRSASITNLQVIDINVQFDVLQALLTATPNVRHLKLFSITDECLPLVSSALPHLESLSLELFEATAVTDQSLFPNLKEFSAKAYRAGFKLSAEGCDQGNFEKLIVQNMKEVVPIADYPKQFLQSKEVS